MTTAVIPTSPPPAQGDGNFYYILTDEFPYGSKLFQAGHMCFISERSYMHFISSDTAPKSHLRVTMLQDNSTVTVSVEVLQPLKDREPGFLLAIGNQRERLNCFLERQGLEAAMEAKLGQQVVVNPDLQHFPGIIRYIGRITQATWSPLSPTFFGVELQVRYLGGAFPLSSSPLNVMLGQHLILTGRLATGSEPAVPFHP